MESYPMRVQQLSAKIMTITLTKESAKRMIETCDAILNSTPEVYVFHRADGFYPIELSGDSEARKNAECNPGTIKVTAKSGRQVWPEILE